MSIETLQQFKSTHQFKRIDGNILFNAEVKFYTGTQLNTIISTVQIILLPNEIAVYILEFLKEDYNITEMYSTGQYYFNCPDSTILEIRENNEKNSFLISLLPIPVKTNHFIRMRI